MQSQPTCTTIADIESRGNRGAEVDRIMKKVKSSGERIRELRGKETQADFAERLGVKRAAVSSWEKDDELRKPSAAVFLKLAGLASNAEDVRFFIKQAGLTDDAIFSVGRKIGRRPVAAAPGDIVEVRPLAGTTDVGEVLLAAGGAASVDFMSYFVADEECAQLILAPGIVIVDTSDRGNKVRPFWDEIVLAKLPDITEEDRVRRPGRLGGHLLGKVWRVHALVPKGYGGAFNLQAWLGGIEKPERRMAVHDRGTSIGFMSHEDWGKESFHQKVESDHEFFDQAIGELHERAHREMETHEGCEIVGRVIAWLPLGPAHGKEAPRRRRK